MHQILLALLLVKNLFLGATYSYDLHGGKLEERDPVHVRHLSDEWIAPYYNNYDYILYHGGALDVIYDLGEGEHALSVLEVDAYCDWHNIVLPSTVKVLASQDGREYSEVGKVDVTRTSAEPHKQLIEIKLDKPVTDRYVKVAFANPGRSITFDEIRGFEFCEDGDIDYEAGKKTNETTEFYKGTSIDQFLPMKREVCERNTPAEKVISMLTDGRKAESADPNDPAWVRFNRGGGRHLVFDLGEQKSIKGLSAEFLSDASNGISVPPVLVVSVSDDMENWVTTYGDTTGMYASPVKAPWNLDARFKQPAKARYVRLSFETERVYTGMRSVYISEVSIDSANCLCGAVAPKLDTSIRFGRWPLKKEVRRNAVFYSSFNPHDTKHQIDSTQAKDLFSMYDGVCFINFGRRDGTKWEVMDDFNEALFAPGRNLDAVDKVADKEIGVWITIFEDREDEYAYFQKQVDRALELWSQHEYRHLKLEGFYYMNEGEDENGEAAVKKLSEYIHSLPGNMQFFWCPYYGQAVMYRWLERGYDWACAQPNIMFHGHAHDNLHMAFQTAWILGMAVELEIDTPESPEVRALYRQYLEESERSGAAASMKLFYVGGTPCAILRSKEVHDETADFIMKNQ